MTRDITISVGELRTALNELLDAVEGEHGWQLALEDTAYWDLPVTAAFDLMEPDPVLTVGEVSDDIDAVRDLTRHTGEIVAIWHEISHVVGVLRAIERAALP